MSKQKEFVLCDGTKNNHGFKIDMTKLDITRFKGNPVMLHVHSSKEQLGVWENLRLENNVLYATPKFFEGDASNDLVKLISARVESGMLKACSVGLDWPTEITYDQDGVPVFETSVLEASIVPVPANQNSVTLYGQNGVALSAQDLELSIKEFTQPEKKPTEIDSEMKLSTEALEALGLSADATEAQINEAIAKQASTLKDVNTQLSALQSQKVTDLVAGAVSEGRITADDKEHYTKLAAADFDLAKATISKLTPISTLPTPQLSAGADGVDRSKWSFKEWSKNDTKGLLQLKADQPEVYAKLLAAN